MEIFAASYLLPISSPPLAGGAIAVDGGRIAAMGPLAELRSLYDAPVHDFPGSIIMPGLVNAHTHLELTHFPSWRLRKDLDYDPRTYTDWVIQVIKIKRGLTPHETELSLLEGFRISVESGATTVGDILTARGLIPRYAATPLGGRLYLEVIGQSPQWCGRLFQELEDSLSGFACAGFVPGISPHAPHTLSDRCMRDAHALARRRSLRTTIHLSESREETEFMHDSTGRIAELLYPFVSWDAYLPPPRRTTSTAYLDSLGVLDPSTAAVHCVHVTPSDAEILKKRGVSVILCPRSNDRLDVGKAPAALFRKLGVPLALGTDSLASNDSLSMWDEMRFLLDTFPDLFTPADALQMATTGGAAALGLAGECGSLEKGKMGDFLVMNAPMPASQDEIPEALIRDGRVEAVFIGGARM